MDNTNIIQLSHEELMTIEAGKSIAYYLGVFVGAAVGTFESLVVGITDGYKDEHHTHN